MPNAAAPGSNLPGGAPARRTFLVNALASYGSTGLLALSSLLLTPYLFRALGTGGFGTWSVMFTLTTVFNMLEVGFAQGTTKFIAEHRAMGQRRKAEATLGASVVLNIGFGILALALSVLLALVASGLAAGDDRNAFREGMVILGIAFLLRFPLASYGAVLAGYQRYDLYNVGQAVTIAGSALGAVILVEAGGGVLGVAIAYAAAFVAGGLTHLLLLKHHDRTLRVLPRRSDQVARRTVLSFSSFTLLADSMNLIGARLDTVVIAALRSAAAAAPFAAANKLHSGLQSLTLPVINLMLPMIADLEARGMRDVIVHRLLVATRVTLQVTMPLALVVAFFSADITDVWLGPTAPDVTAAIITVLALHTLSLCEVPAQRVLLGLGRARTVGLLNTVWGVSNLAISVALVSTFGAIGAAFGTLIAASLVGPAYFPLASRATDYPLSRLLRVGLWPAIASSIPSIALILPVWLLLSPGLGRLLLGLAVGVGAAVAIGALQLGPRRSLAELRNQLREAQPQAPAGGPIVIENPP
jgi:O-antigen/teichoic acid export membrane protein